MNESKDKLSARSKVMDSWHSGWKSISKTPPILPIVDIQMSRSQKLNKSGKKVHQNLNKSFDPTKVITKENTLKLLSKKNNKLQSIRQKDKSIDSTDVANHSSKETPKRCSKDRPKDSSKSNSKDKREELRLKPNASQTDDNLKPKESVNEKSVSEKTDSNNNESKNEKNSILSKLRKRKFDSSNPSDTQSLSKSVPMTKSDKSLDNNKMEVSEDKEIKSIKNKAQEKGIKHIDNNVEPMEVEITPQIKTIQKETVKDTNLKEMQNYCKPVDDIPIAVRSNSESTDSMTDPFKSCIRPDCYKKINRFYIFEGKFCSSECAVKQWTEEFKNWAQNKT